MLLHESSPSASISLGPAPISAIGTALVWSGLSSGADLGASDGVYALEPWGEGGAFYVGGGFLTMNDEVSAHFARWGAIDVVPTKLLQLSVAPVGTGRRISVQVPVRSRILPRSCQTALPTLQGDADHVETEPQRFAQHRLFYRGRAN